MELVVEKVKSLLSVELVFLLFTLKLPGDIWKPFFLFNLRSEL